MFSPTRLALAVAAIGLAGPVAANDGAPPVLANPDLDALTASAVVPGAGTGPGVAGGPLLVVDGSGPAQGIRSARGSGRWSLGRSDTAAGSGSGQFRGAAPSTANAAGDVASAARSVLGGSIGRTVTARSGDSAATASAAAAGPGLSSVGLSAHAGPGFSASASRSASSFSR